VADGARTVVGPAPIAWAEDLAYGVEDRIKRVVYRDAPPRTFWEPSAVADQPPAQLLIASNAPVTPTFAPEPFAPPVPSVAAAGDGPWIAITDPHAPADPPATYKTVVHPDARRSYAAVAVTFLPPRSSSCTVALYRGGSMRIRTFTALRDGAAQMTAYWQTPPCLVEEDRIDDTLLTADDATGWGVSVGGGTVIRRSAIGLDHGGNTLLYAIGESVTAGTLARAMKAAGAENAAQLDVNQAYPHFVLYAAAPAHEAPRIASALIPDLVYSRSEYVGKPEWRDFFYVTRKAH